MIGDGGHVEPQPAAPSSTRKDVAMSDADLATRLRCIPTSLSREAADRIEALAGEVERLKAERVSHVDYSADLQRIIECICHKRDIRTPVTTARYHFDLAVKYRAEAESAERALAEALGHIAILANDMSDVVEAQYMDLKDYPSEARRYERDIAPVRAARDAQEKEKGK
jgi:hypothetical protein